MSYIDGFVLAVPSENRERFRAMAARVADIFIEHGALRVIENWGDDVPDGTQTDMRRAVQAKDGETVVFSWVEWASKEARDAGNEKIAADPRLVPDAADADIMDPKRMIYGGFVPIVDQRAEIGGQSR